MLYLAKTRIEQRRRPETDLDFLLQPDAKGGDTRLTEPGLGHLKPVAAAVAHAPFNRTHQATCGQVVVGDGSVLVSSSPFPLRAASRISAVRKVKALREIEGAVQLHRRRKSPPNPASAQSPGYPCGAAA